MRAAAVYALGTYIGGAEESERRTNIDLNLGLTLPVVTADASPMVRRSLVVALGQLVNSYRSQFKDVALEVIEEEIQLQQELDGRRGGKKDKRSKQGISLSPLPFIGGFLGVCVCVCVVFFFFPSGSSCFVQLSKDISSSSLSYSNARRRS